MARTEFVTGVSLIISMTRPIADKVDSEHSVVLTQEYRDLARKSLIDMYMYERQDRTIKGCIADAPAFYQTPLHVRDCCKVVSFRLSGTRMAGATSCGKIFSLTDSSSRILFDTYKSIAAGESSDFVCKLKNHCIYIWHKGLNSVVVISKTGVFAYLGSLQNYSTHRSRVLITLTKAFVSNPEIIEEMGWLSYYPEALLQP